MNDVFGAHHPERGQSLLEAVIAVSVVIIAAAAMLTLTTRSLTSERDTADTLIASNLAREGIEAVHAIRDSNWLASGAFDAGLSDVAHHHLAAPVFDVTAGNTGFWALDFSTASINDASAAVWQVNSPNVGEVLGMYLQDQPGLASRSNATPYKRVITLNDVCSDGTVISASGAGCGSTKIGIQVLSTVQWNTPRGNRTVTLEDWLYNWH